MSSSANIDENMITVNNVFAHWIREIEVKRYWGDLQIVPSSTVDIYKYSDSILKYMPKDELNTFERTLLFSREQVLVVGNLDRQCHKSGTAAQRTDVN